MTSKVEIINLALIELGDDTIASPSQNIKRARVVDAVYDAVLRALLQKNVWNFAKEKRAIAADPTPPVFGFANRYGLPADFLSLNTIGDRERGRDINRLKHEIVGDFIETDGDAPLKIEYIRLITDTTKFPPLFVTAFARALAETVAEALTQSNSKVEQARLRAKDSLQGAESLDALEGGNQELPEDIWVTIRN